MTPTARSPAHHPGCGGHGRPERGGGGGGGPGRRGHRAAAPAAAAGAATAANGPTRRRCRRATKRTRRRPERDNGTAVRRAGPSDSAGAGRPRRRLRDTSAAGGHGHDFDLAARQPAAASTAARRAGAANESTDRAGRSAAPDPGPVGMRSAGRPIVGPWTATQYRGGMEGTPGWLKDLIRDIPDFPQPGVVFKDITPLLASGAALRWCVEALARRLPASRRSTR